MNFVMWKKYFKCSISCIPGTPRIRANFRRNIMRVRKGSLSFLILVVVHPREYRLEVELRQNSRASNRSRCRHCRLDSLSRTLFLFYSSRYYHQKQLIADIDTSQHMFNARTTKLVGLQHFEIRSKKRLIWITSEVAGSTTCFQQE